MTALYSQTIKNLVAGISQQPQVLRHPEQLNEQINGFSTEAAGLQKRPPTQYVAPLTKEVNVGNKPLVHFINRDDYEKYIVTFTGSDVMVFDLNGSPMEVHYESEDARRYITTQSPRSNLKCQTIADYTFISNIYAIPRMSTEITEDVWATQGALVNIKSGQYGRTYRVDINGNSIASYTTPDGSDKSHTGQIATDYIASQLATQARNAGYEVQTGSSWLYITKSSNNTIEKKYWREPSTSYEQQEQIFESMSRTSGRYYPKTDKLLVTAFKAGEDAVTLTSQALAEINRCSTDYWEILFLNEVRCELRRKGFWETVIEPNTATDIKSVSVYDGYNNQAAFGVLKTVQKFSMLPVSAPAGFTVKVAGESGSTTDDYYIRYDASENLWKECVRPGIPKSYDLQTMPHVLVRQADGSFLLRRAEWEERKTGDEDSNPEPSFIGYPIKDIVYFRNRLCFIAGENVILSQSAGFFNFWMVSTKEVQDTDAIDLAISDNKIATLHHAVPYDENLVLMSDDAQFILRCEGVLTPKTANIPPAVTRFGNSLKAKPATAGRNLYFTAERSQYTTVREFFTAADNTESKDAQDITSHVSNYIPNGVYKIVTSPVENLLLFLTEGASNCIYVYKYLFIDSVRQQAAWSHWDFGDGTVFGADFFGGIFFVVIERDGILFLEKMSFTYNTADFEDEPYRIYLDRKVPYVIPEDSYNPVTERTSFNLKDVYDSSDLISFNGFALVDTKGTYMELEVAADGSVAIEGDWHNKTVFIGQNFTMKVGFSTLMIRKETQSGTKAIDTGRLQLRSFWVNFSDSGTFLVSVDIKDRNKFEYLHTSRTLGNRNSTLGSLVFSTDQFKVPIQSLNTNCDITITSTNPNPVALIGAGWEGSYYRRSKPI
ncbi:hypothetical protein [Phascolarctobacterium faecium]|uniref:phage nozzle protein n=1 Tax=Phascolarctobacterium faecium TaxID=33025 RepID=UPI0035206195